ncbi:hypoxia induced protein conserved region-domain-containing protein [Syncephalis fuscata]|nr:hypoxia induced protein conserved region-domain-containing protein [Syncephalis fuscata]
MERPYTFFENLKHRVKEQPVVAGGLGLTCTALIAASVYIRRGNRKMGNQMLRLRVLAQGFTVAALLIGATQASYKKKETTNEAVSTSSTVASTNT